MKIANPTAKLGEDLASEYLAQHGYTILERNFRTRNGEIDIIAVTNDEKTKEHVLVFVEVKTRTSYRYGIPLEAITYQKLQSLLKTAAYYTALHKHLPSLQRMDAVSVDLTHQVPQIEVHQNITTF